MNFRNKKAVVIFRVLLGLIFLMSGVTGLMAGSAMHGVPLPMVPVSQQLWHMGIFQMIKTTEIIAGILFVFGWFPALAAIFVAPICVGILVFTSRVAPAYIVSGLVVTVLDIYMGYAYWDKYKAIVMK